MKEEIDNTEKDDTVEEDEEGEMDEFIGHFTDFYQP
jgi:hypothetical protein